MSSNQRLEVWRGTRAKTSGGLTKAMLTKNKRGKIVSKKKSSQASSQNNLGSWLREKGKKVPKDKMLRKKGDVPGADSKKGGKAGKAAKAPAAPKQAPKAKPKQAQAKPKKKAPPKVTRKETKAAPQTSINPLTKQPYAEKNKTGYVTGGNVSLDNVRRTKLRPRRRKINYKE